MNTCGQCRVHDCEPYLVWNPFEQQRVIMCSKRVECIRHLYGADTAVSVVLDPAVECEFAALMDTENDDGRFMGSYCTECECRVRSEQSPGLRIGDVVLCRDCVRTLDQIVFDERLSVVVGGETVTAANWCMVQLYSSIGVKALAHQYGTFFKYNRHLVKALSRRMNCLRICDGD